MSSFDTGWSGGTVAKLSKPAIISRATPSTNFFPKLEYDFIAAYPLLAVLPILRKRLARLARSPTILQAHLAQLAGISLRFGNCEGYGSHSADFPFLPRGCVLIRVHKFFSGPPE